MLLDKWRRAYAAGESPGTTIPHNHDYLAISKPAQATIANLAEEICKLLYLVEAWSFARDLQKGQRVRSSARSSTKPLQRLCSKLCLELCSKPYTELQSSTNTQHQS